MRPRRRGDVHGYAAGPNVGDFNFGGSLDRGTRRWRKVPGGGTARTANQRRQQRFFQHASPGEIDGDAVRRARELALRPDVTALVALREAVLRRAEQTGRKDDPAIARELQEIDRCLLEARALRLRLDAAAIRKGT